MKKTFFLTADWLRFEKNILHLPDGNQKSINHMLDVKKSPKASLEDKKFIYLLVGFVLALSLVYIAFEWTNKEITVYEDVDTDFVFEEELDIVQTAETPPPPPPPPAAPVVVEVLNVVENTEEVEAVEIVSEDDETEEIVIDVPVAAPIEEEEEEVVFQVVEKMPQFLGTSATRSSLRKTVCKGVLSASSWSTPTAPSWISWWCVAWIPVWTRKPCALSSPCRNGSPASSAARPCA